MTDDVLREDDDPERDRWLGIELRHLAALAAVGRQGSFSGAADALGYVQSAVSQQIRALERITGHRLVERSSGRRSVAVTEAGEALLEHVDEILEQLELAKADVDVLTRASQGTVSIGIASLFGRWLPAALLAGLARQDGGRGWGRLERAAADVLLRQVADGRLDVAFVPLPIAAGPFFALELTREAHVLVVPAAAMTPTATVDTTLARMPLVQIEACAATAALRARPPGRGAPHAADGPLSALELVRAGAGVAVMTSRDAPRHDPSIATLPLPDVPAVVVGMAWHRDRDGCSAVTRLRSVARHAVGRHR